MNIVLIGMSGSGKTSVGNLIRESLSMEVVDTDQEIRQELGMDIDQIFSLQGEDYFRQVESQVLKNQIGKANTVFATGGGIILKEENRKLLRQLGTVVLLEASVPTLMRNLKASQEIRPLLKEDKSLEEDLRAMLNKRQAIYSQAADYTINIDKLGLEEVLELVMKIKNLVQ